MILENIVRTFYLYSKFIILSLKIQLSMGLSEDELDRMRARSAWVFTYSGLVTDFIELNLIIFTIIYVIVQLVRTRAE